MSTDNLATELLFMWPTECMDIHITKDIRVQALVLYFSEVVLFSKFVDGGRFEVFISESG